MNFKRIRNIILLLIVIQLLRICFKFIIFEFVNRSIFVDTLVSIVFMVIMTIAILVFAVKKDIKLNIFPEKFNKIYLIASIVVFGIFALTPLITQNYEISSIVSLIYGAFITVIFEEILFRGLVYEEISNNKTYKFLLSTLVFGFWHLGYIDTIIFRTSLFNPTADIFNIMVWKVITGLILGLIFGFLKYKTDNTYSSMLAHMLVNAIGS